MRPSISALVLLLVAACGDDSSGDSATAADSGDGSATAATASGSGGSSSTGGTVTNGTNGSAETGDASTSGVSGSDSNTAGGTGAPTQRYRGAVIGGSVPGWDPDDPDPLLMMGRLPGTQTWAATLAQVGPDGALSQNVADEIIVWGWDNRPDQLYDGPVVGGSIPGWSSANPIPVVMMGHLPGTENWVATLARIAPDGSLSENLADRIIVWGWPTAGPALRYEGGLDGMLPGWDSDNPEPLVMLARFAADDTWQSTLTTILPDGSFGMNIADELKVWGW